jgi:hypothetical protein
MWSAGAANVQGLCKAQLKISRFNCHYYLLQILSAKVSQIKSIKTLQLLCGAEDVNVFAIMKSGKFLQFVYDLNHKPSKIA